MARRLKPLRIEMDLAESGIKQKAFIKWRGEEIFSKICPSLIMWEPLKVSKRLLILMGNYLNGCQKRGIKNPYVSEMFFAGVPKARAFGAPIPADKKNWW